MILKKKIILKKSVLNKSSIIMSFLFWGGEKEVKCGVSISIIMSLFLPNWNEVG